MIESDYADVEDDEASTITTKSDEEEIDGQQGATSSQGAKKHEENDRRWDEMFHRLLAFREEHGHCRVPTRYEKDRKLGIWVASQRRQYKIYSAGSNGPRAMTPDRASRLNEIGFEWAAKHLRCVPWETRFGQLLEFVEKNGHAHVPIGWEENFQLSNWVSAQRQEFRAMQKGQNTRLNQDRIELLNSIGFVWDAQKGGLKRNRDGRHVSSSLESNEADASESATYRKIAKILLKEYTTKGRSKSSETAIKRNATTTETAATTSESSVAVADMTVAAATPVTEDRGPIEATATTGTFTPGQPQQQLRVVEGHQNSSTSQRTTNSVGVDSHHVANGLVDAILGTSQDPSILQRIIELVPNLANTVNSIQPGFNDNAARAPVHQTSHNFQPQGNIWSTQQVQNTNHNQQPQPNMPVPLDWLSTLQSLLSLTNTNSSSVSTDNSRTIQFNNNAPAMSGDIYLSHGLQVPSVSAQSRNPSTLTHNPGAPRQQSSLFPYDSRHNDSGNEGGQQARDRND